MPVIHTLVVDRVLDNHHAPYSYELIRLFYHEGDKEITENQITFHERSGYFLFSENPLASSVSIARIGEVITSRDAGNGLREWEVFAHVKDRNYRRALLITDVMAYRRKLLAKAFAIPIFAQGSML